MDYLSRAWERLWFSHYDPISLGAFRLSLGVLLVAYYVSLGPNWDYYYAPDGMLSVEAMKPTPQQRPVTSVFRWTENTVPVRVFWWVGLAAAAGFALGWRPRIWAAVLFLMHTSMMATNQAIIVGEDIVTRLLLFYCLFAPLGATLSIDAWLARRAARPQATEDPVGPTIWPVRLMQINVALIYLGSVLHRLFEEPSWRDGTAVYYTLVGTTWSRWPWPELLHGYQGEVLSALLTYSTLTVEGLFPLVVWFRRTRTYVLAAVTLLHLGAALTIDTLLFFQLTMICSFWLFVPPEVTRRWGRGLGRLFGKRTGKASSATPPSS